jgi:hypothetical protein
MSLEEKLDVNTTALLANTVALDLLRAHIGHLTGELKTTAGGAHPKPASGTEVASGPATAANRGAPTPTVSGQTRAAASAAKGASALTATDPKPAAASQPKVTAAALPAPEAGAITYKDVQIELNKLASQAPEGRAKAVAILAELGVANGTQLKPEQWGVARDAFIAAQGDYLG